MLTLKEMIINVLQEHKGSMTVRDLTKCLVELYPEKLTSKMAQKDGDEKAAFDQIYREIQRTTISYDNTFFRDKSHKPLQVGLVEENDEAIEIEAEDENFESDYGTVYILGTQTFDRDGNELVKIGFTTLPVQERMRSLYTSGVPFEFTILREYTTPYYVELEKAMHKLLNSFRPNPAREFFSRGCLNFADDIYALHKQIEAL